MIVRVKHQDLFSCRFHRDRVSQTAFAQREKTVLKTLPKSSLICWWHTGKHVLGNDVWIIWVEKYKIKKASFRTWSIHKISAVAVCRPTNDLESVMVGGISRLPEVCGVEGGTLTYVYMLCRSDGSLLDVETTLKRVGSKSTNSCASCSVLLHSDLFV